MLGTFFSCCFCVIVNEIRRVWVTLVQPSTGGRQTSRRKRDNGATAWTGGGTPHSDTAGGGGGGSEPNRILHEGRGQGQPAIPGFSSLLYYNSVSQARKPEQGAALVLVGCPVMKVREQRCLLVRICHKKTLTVYQELTAASRQFLILQLILASSRGALIFHGGRRIVHLTCMCYYHCSKHLE